MVDFLDLPKMFGEEALDKVGQRVGLLGAKAATLAATDQEDVGRGFLDVSSVFDTSDGVTTRILSPVNFQESPSLFVTIPFGDKRVWTPFMQVGTVAGVEDDFLRLAMDFILDPINLASFGTLGAGAKVGGKLASIGGKGVAARGLRAVGRGLEAGPLSGLTFRGRIQRVTDVLLDGAALGRSGDDLVKQMDNALQLAGNVIGSGRRDAVIAAARRGDAKALRGLFDDAISSGQLDEGTEFLLGQVRRDSKAMARMLEKSDVLASQAQLGPQSFLQAFGTELMAQGAVNPLLSFTRLSNPIKKPWAFTRQMMGFAYRGERMAVPGSRFMADGLDAVLKPVVRLPDDLQLKPLLSSTDAMRGRELAGGDATFFDLDAAAEPVITLLAAPREQMSRMFSELDMNEAALKKVYKQATGMAADSSIPKNHKGFARFQQGVMRRMNEGLKAQDKVVADLVNDAIENGIGRIEEAAAFLPAERAGQALRTAKGDLLDAGQQLVKTRTEQLRNWQSLFTLDSIASDGFSMGHGFAARADSVSALIHNMKTIMEDITIRHYGGRNSALVSEVFPRIVENPDLFKVADDGMLRVAPDVTEEVLRDASPFLDDVFKRDRDGVVRQLLFTQGVNPEMQAVMSLMDRALTTAGDTLLAEGVVRHLFAEYFPRRFEANKQFFKRFRTSRTRLREFSAAKFDTLLAAERFDDMLEGLGEGTVTFSQVRKVTEEIALKLEAKGQGRYVRDAYAVFAGYLESANKALMVNTLVRDLAQVAPKLTNGVLTDAEKKLLKSGDIDDMGVVMDNDHPLIDNGKGRAADIYEGIDVAPRPLEGEVTRKSIQREAVTEAVEGIDPAQGIKGARERLAKRYGGQTKFKVGDNQQVQLKIKGKPVKLNPKWITTNRWPKSVEGAMQAKRFFDDAAARLASEQVSKAAARQAAKKLPKETLPTKIWVWKGAARPLQESLRLFTKTGDVGPFTRLYDDFNYSLKSFVLMGDIFHYNVLAFNSTLADPASFIRNLRDSAGSLLPGVREGAGLPSLNAARGAAVGAVGGGVGAAGLGEDPSDILAGSAVGALYGALIGSARQNALHTKKALQMNPSASDTLMWMGLGGWRGRPDDRSIGFMTNWLQDVTNRMLRNGRSNLLVSPLSGLAHASEAWDRELWSLMHNGSKHAYFTEAWNQWLPRLQQSEAYATKTLNREFERLKADNQLTDRLAKLDLVRKPEVPLSPRQKTPEEQAFFVLVDDSGTTGKARVPPHLASEASGLAPKSPSFAPRFDEVFKAAAADEGGDFVRFVYKPGEVGNAVYTRHQGWYLPGQGLIEIRDHSDIHEFSALWGPDDLLLHGGVRTSTVSGSQGPIVSIQVDKMNPRHLEAIDDLLLDPVPKGGRVLIEDAPDFRRANKMSTDELFSSTSKSHTFSADTLNSAGKPSKVIRQKFKIHPLPTEARIRERPPLRDVLSDVPEAPPTPRTADLIDDQLRVPQGPGVDPRLRKFIANRRFEMKRQLASELMQSSNNLFGGQAFKNLVNNPQYQFGLRKFLLAPDWTLSRLNGAATMFMNMGPMKASLMGAGLGSLFEMAELGFDDSHPPWRGIMFGGGLGALSAKWANFTARAMRTPGNRLAAEARRLTATALLGGYTFSTLTNKAFTGRWMHENEPHKRLSIEMPGTDAIGRPRFVTLGKQWKEFGEFGSFVDPEKFPVPVISRTASKLAIPLRYGVDVFSNSDFYGPIFIGKDEPWDIAAKGVRFTLSQAQPIIFGGPIQATAGAVGELLGGEPPRSTFGEALIRAVGFPVSKSREFSGVSNQAIQDFLDSSF